MTGNPFKFLDSYTRDDKEIFFGRDREIEEMYQKVFESKILLLYGISGTGKTSLINCGLANKFEDSDWLPVTVRRGRSMVESLVVELKKNAIPPSSASGRTLPPGGDKSAVGSRQYAVKDIKPEKVVKSLKSLYLDHFKPIYLIFDQFEELFIFGDREEREQFIQVIKAIVDSDVQCRLIFSIREEYLASVTEFELTLTDFLANRMRVEKMTRQHAVDVIEGPCKVHGIEVEKGFSEALLNKLNPDSNEVELTYLQVFLDKIFRLSTTNDTTQSVVNDSLPTVPSTNSFTIPLLEKIGDVSDLLGSFLEEQISILDDPAIGLAILKSFVSLKGTRKQISEEEIQDAAKTFGQDIPNGALKELLQEFVNLRILKDKDETDRYELRHDSLADKIYEKITLVEKDLLEVRQFLENALDQYEKRKIHLTGEDLKYIAPLKDKLFLNQRIEIFIENSKNFLVRTKRRKRQILSGAVVTAFIVLLFFTIWAVVERAKATRALKEKEIAEEKLVEAAKDFVMFTRNLNILYKGIENPVSFAIPGMPKGRLFFDSNFPMSLDTDENEMILIPNSTGTATINLSRIIENDTSQLGSREFDVRNLPTPIPTLFGKTGGFILRDSLVVMEAIKAIIKDFDYEYEFSIISYELSFEVNEGTIATNILSNNITRDIRNQFNRIRHNSKINFREIRVIGTDNVLRNLGTLSLTVVRWFNYDSYSVLYSLFEEKIDKKDWESVKRLGTENVRKYYWDHPRELNKFAYLFYLHLEDTDALQNALEWSEHAVEIGNSNRYYLFTLSCLEYKLGMLDEAEKTVKIVIKSFKDHNEPTQEYEVFLDQILEAKK